MKSPQPATTHTFWDTLKRIIKFGALNKGLFLLVLALTFLVQGIGLLKPQIIKLFFDLVQSTLSQGNDFDFAKSSFFLYVGLYALTLLMETIVNLSIDYSLELWWYRLNSKIITIGFKHIETLSLSFFEKTPTGMIKERLEKGIDGIVHALNYIFLDIFPQLVFIIGASILLFRINNIFGLVMIIGLPLYVIVTYPFQNVIAQKQKEFRKTEEQISSTAVETFSNIKTVKSFATEKRHLTTIINQLNYSLKLTAAIMWKHVQMWFWRANIGDISLVIILAYGSYLAITGDITIGTLYLAWAYTSMSYDPLSRVMRSFDRLKRSFVEINRFLDLLDMQPEIQDSPSAKKMKKSVQKIEFKQLHFKYRNKPVLDGLNLTVAPRTVVAIVGKSGVGKSTIVKLLMRLYDPSSGCIEFDGIDIRRFTQKSLRQSLGIVLQDSSLFNETVYNNISYAVGKTNKKNVVRAAKAANAHSFIMKLPEGYDTVIGERGVRLSGGEQQRINIARVFLKNPPVIVLDEATSSLDSESEELIQRALWKLITGKTAIIIAHRLSTVMKADLIAVMDKGKISEIGTHKDLVAKKGIYAKLFEIQSGGYLK